MCSSRTNLHVSGRLSNPIFRLLVWIGVVVSSISLFEQFSFAVSGHLPPIALISINVPMSACWIALDVYWWFGGTVARVCGFSSTKFGTCQNNVLALVEFAFMCLMT